MNQCTQGHFPGGGLTDCAVMLQGLGAHTEHLLLRLDAVRDESALEPIGAAGNRREHGDDESAGARLCGGQAQSALTQE